MEVNSTLKYRTFDSLLEDVTVDFSSYALENMIEPQQLIKVAKRVTYDLGLRINQTKEVMLEVCHGKVKLPDDFYTFNFAFICGNYEVRTGYDIGGTNIQEVRYQEVPSTVDQCAAPTVNCSTCNSNPCNHTAGCIDANTDFNMPLAHDPNNPYGDTCIKPRVFLNCKNEAYELIQVVNNSQSRIYKVLIPLRMTASKEIGPECPNLYYNALDSGYIKNGFLYTTVTDAKIYLNYQGAMEDEDGNLLVPDHDMLNDYYEYALKQRLLENLYIEQRLKVARNNALNIVNMPNFAEMKKLWQTNRKAMYGKYYDMFKSYPINSIYTRNYGPTTTM